MPIMPGIGTYPAGAAYGVVIRFWGLFEARILSAKLPCRSLLLGLNAYEADMALRKGYTS